MTEIVTVHDEGVALVAQADQWEREYADANDLRKQQIAADASAAVEALKRIIENTDDPAVKQYALEAQKRCTKIAAAEKKRQMLAGKRKTGPKPVDMSAAPGDDGVSENSQKLDDDARRDENRDEQRRSQLRKERDELRAEGIDIDELWNRVNALIDDKATDLDTAYSRVKRKMREEIATEASAINAKIADEVRSAWTPTLHVVSCADMVNVLEPASIDALICDPPYPDEYLYVWPDLAALALHALRPGGVLAAMIPDPHIPTVLADLDAEGLRWRTMIAALQPGAAKMMWGKRAISNWKPVAVFMREPTKVLDWRAVSNVVVPAELRQQLDKRHDWAQNPKTWTGLVQTLTEPGQTVLDPFAGSGVTGFAARESGCDAILSDIDETAIATAKEWLSG